MKKSQMFIQFRVVAGQSFVVLLIGCLREFALDNRCLFVLMMDNFLNGPFLVYFSLFFKQFYRIKFVDSEGFKLRSSVQKASTLTN